MTTPLFMDNMDMDSMFSPTLFTKSEDLSDFPDFRNDARTMHPSFTPINTSQPQSSSSYPMLMSTAVSDAPVPAPCFPPSATLMSPEDIPSPQFELSNWDASTIDSNSGWIDPAADFQQATLPRALSHQRRYGQLTPPDDLSPKTQAAPDLYAQAEDTDRRTVKEESSSTKKNSSTTATGSKRRSNKSSGTNSDPSAPAPKRSRKSRKTAKATTNDPEEDSKRERFLERNRVAASKCRQKKKEWTSQLEDDERQQKALNMYLRRCVAQLKEELLYLKGECLKHSDCNCEAIRQHMASTIPMMQRPSQALYEAGGSFSGQSRPSIASTRGDLTSEAATSPSVSDESLAEDDMRELLSTTLEQDVPE